MSKLAIGDTHAPATHPKYLRFCENTYKAYGCKASIFIGDIADQYIWSRYGKDPDALSPEQEYEAACKVIKRWHDAFPHSRVCEGNHDIRMRQKAAEAALPKAVVRSYNDLWGTPSWDWQPSHDVDGVHYTHGIGMSGMYAYRNAAQKNMRSTVIGHVHSFPGIAYIANTEKLIFGMNVGCGIDIKHYSMRYTGCDILRPILGCGIVRDEKCAQFVPMDLTDKRYRR